MRGAGCGAGREETGEAAEGLQDAVARGHLRLQPCPILAPRLRLPRFESLATFYSPANPAWPPARRLAHSATVWLRVPPRCAWCRGAAKELGEERGEGSTWQGRAVHRLGEVHGNAEPIAFGGLLIL